MFWKRRKKKSWFKVGDKVTLRPNWKVGYRQELCAYCQEPARMGKVYTVESIGDATGCLYLSTEDDGTASFGRHHTCKNSPELFVLAMTIEECINLIYQKITEALMKPR